MPLMSVRRAAGRSDAAGAGGRRARDAGRRSRRSRRQQTSTKNKAKDQAEAREKPKEENPQFRLDDHPSIDFGKGTHLDFRARFAADGIDSEASTAESDWRSSDDRPREEAHRRLGRDRERHRVPDRGASSTDDDPWRDVYGEFKQFAVRARARRQVQDPLQPRREHRRAAGSTSCSARSRRRTSRRAATSASWCTARVVEEG